MATTLKTFKLGEDWLNTRHAVDIAELNPAYDIDNQTAKLAASRIHRIINNV